MSNGLQVETVVAKRLHRGVNQYKIKWANIPERGSTWEPADHLGGPDAAEKIKKFEEDKIVELEVLGQLLHAWLPLV